MSARFDLYQRAQKQKELAEKNKVALDKLMKIVCKGFIPKICVEHKFDSKIKSTN